MRFREPVDPNYGISHIEYMTPRPFDPSRIKGNTYQCGDVTMVRIPNIDGRISERNQDNRTYIDYIYATWYDPETQQTRNRKKIIGRYIDDFPGFMIPNENYSQFFDFATGKELPQPKTEEESTNKSKAPKELNGTRNPAEQTTAPDPEIKKPAAKGKAPVTEPAKETTKPSSKTKEPADTPSEKRQNQKDQPTANTTPMSYDPMKKVTAQGRKELVNALIQAQQQKQQEEAKKAVEEAKMSEDDEERRWAEEREQYIAFKEHFELVKNIFNEAYDTIQKQARKSPNAVVSLYTVQRINETIAEIQDLLKDSEVENYIILLDEPKETEPEQEEKENKPAKPKRSAKFHTPKLTGLTFSDVEIIMGQISSVLHWYEWKRIDHSIY